MNDFVLTFDVRERFDRASGTFKTFLACDHESAARAYCAMLDPLGEAGPVAVEVRYAGKVCNHWIDMTVTPIPAVLWHVSRAKGGAA